MRRFTYLPGEFIFILVIIWIYAIWNWAFGFKILVSITLFLIFYFFRRSSIPYRDTLKNDGEIFLSPVHGIVKSINRDSLAEGDFARCHEIRISMGAWDEKGLYLPTAAEVSYLKANKGRKIARSAPDHEFYRPIEELSHTDLVFTSKNQTKTLMRFIDCKFGKRPEIWLKSGDRGRAAACFGHYTFGGTLVIYVPQNSDILVFENERVVPGQTVIAAFKDVK